jgi:hypothetical protein
VRLTWETRVDWASLFILSDTCFLAGLCLVDFNLPTEAFRSVMSK